MIVVSDFITPDHDWEKSLRSVAAKHDVVVAQIMDPHIVDPGAGAAPGVLVMLLLGAGIGRRRRRR